MSEEVLVKMTCKELRDLAREKNVSGRWDMQKSELIAAILESEKSNDVKQRIKYVENVEVGTIVAFKLSNGKVKSAKVMKKSTKNRKLKLETDYGAEYIVDYNDIVWVRTGKRWPRGVYNLMKGLVEDGKKE